MAKSQKELDKDVMYAKLMPSRPLTEEEAPPPPLREETGGERIALLRARLFGEPGGYPETGDGAVMLKNLMEDLILERLDDAFAKFKCCQCDHCRKDVVAIALNKLPCRYAVGSPDQLREQAKEIPTKDISVALVQAILRVRANPRH